MKFLRSSLLALPLLMAALPLGAAPTSTVDAPKPAEKATESAKPVWPQDVSDLVPDPNVVWGQLPNGIRYAVLKHTEPPKRISLRLRVAAGSLMEKEDQRGLAHFLEHMAFNGGEHFPPGSLVEYFQRLGMGFGGDTNAFTTFDQTVYELELPDDSPDLVSKALTLFHDDATGMLLQEKEIDNERGVILSEKRDRNSVDYRTWVDETNFILPNTLIPKRITIGDADVIQGADRATFEDYYRGWYTPDRLLVVAVGDFDPQAMVQQIKDAFSDIPANPHPRPDPDLGTIGDRGVAARVHKEPEAPSVMVDLQTVRRFDGAPDSIARRAHDIAVAIANAIVSRRLDILSKKEGAPFTSGSAYSQVWMNFVHNAGVQLNCPPDKWQDAEQVAEHELRKALQYGFTQAELDEARAKMLNGYKEAVRTAATRKSREISAEIVSAINDDSVFTSPGQDLKLAQPVLEQLTPESVQVALRKDWAGDTRLIYVSGNLPEDATDDAVLAAYNKAAAMPVEAPKAAETAKFAYTDFGTPGTIASKNYIEDLDITQLRLSNNVYVNLKPTKFEDNTIRILVRIGGGLLELPRDEPGLSLLANVAFTAGGLEKHSADDIERLFAGKTVGVDFGVGSDAFTFTGSTNQADLGSELDLLTAYITAPGYRDEALRQARQVFPQLYIQIGNTPQGVIQDKVASYLAGGDPRFGYPPQQDVMQRNLDELRQWLSGPLSHERMEVSIVGDFDIDKAVPLLLKTFGALPGRDADKPAYTEARKVDMPSPDDTVHTFDFTSAIPKAVALTAWHTADQWDVSLSRRLNVLAAIVEDRMRIKVREQLGAAYSPYAYNSPSDTFKDYGYMQAFIMIDPTQASKLASVAQEIGGEIAAKGTNQDELDRMLKPLLEHIKEVRRNNQYWLGTVLGSCQEYPIRLEWARSMVDDMTSITVDQINALAKKYLQPDEAIRISVVPVAPPSPAPAEQPAAQPAAK